MSLILRRNGEGTIKTFLDTKLLDEISAEAQTSECLCMNRNLHDSLDAKAQRLLNALDPGTILPIHCHSHTADTHILLRGRIDVMFYDDSGVESARFALDPPSGRYCVHIPAGQWHTLEVLKSGSVIFEVKHGPYTPFEPEDILYWPGLSVKGIA